MSGSPTKPLDIQVINCSVGSMAANVALLKGEHSSLLVDAPFTRADAYRVVAEILDGGKPLETVLVTHDHPDHFFGLDVIVEEFRDAKIVAEAQVCKDIARSVPIKFNRWGPMLGLNAPRYGVFPKPLEHDHLMFEGHRIEIRGPVQGDHARCTYVWIPESRTIIANDIVYNGVYLFLGEHLEPEYERWLKALDELEALKPATVIAGHRRPDLPNDDDGIAFTRRYIHAFAKAAKECKTSAELGARMHAEFPDAIDVAGGFLVGVSSQVATREIPPWDE